MKSVLVIEDNYLIAELTRSILKGAGFEVLHASTGRDGIKLALEHLPSLIICDIMMPEMDGYAVLKLIRSHPETMSAPFIFLTSKSDRNDMRQGMNLGADDYLIKPFSAQELLSCVNIRLQRHQAMAQHIESQSKSMTGLPGRTPFLAKLRAALNSRGPDQQVAVLLLDLDRFRGINNALGHECGNHLIQLMASRMKDYVQAPSSLYHFGEDEFAVLSPAVNDAQAIGNLASNLLHSIRLPTTWKQHQLFITASIGVSICPQDTMDLDALVSYAEISMHEAKEMGRNLVCFYHPALKAGAVDRLLLENGIRNALESNLFQLHYQPQLDLNTEKIIGAEALIRWTDAELGPIPPSKFIPIAEESGLILPLGDWVLQTACHHIRDWSEAGLRGVKFSVNLSGRQLKDRRFLPKLEHLLQETNLEPSLLGLELTESILMAKTDDLVATFRKIKDMGISISIDDFGTGYSSLSYLKQFPIDVLKIDQSFVRDITAGHDGQAIPAAIITMAHSLGMKVIAEGVETHEQLETLRQQGCDAIQGYFFSKPQQSDLFFKFCTQS